MVKKVNETNELLEIWKDFFDLDRDYTLKENRKRQRRSRGLFYKYDRKKILWFWHLKANIDEKDRIIKDLKKQVLSFKPTF